MKRAKGGCCIGTVKVAHFGFTVIELMVCMAILAVLIAILLPSVQVARESARRTQCKNNLRQIAMATHLYETQHGNLPPGCLGAIHGTKFSPESFGQGSWIGHLGLVMPYLEQAATWENLKHLVQSTSSTVRPWFNDPQVLVHTNSVQLSVLTCPSFPDVQPVGTIAALNMPDLLIFVGAVRGGMTNYLGSAGTLADRGSIENPAPTGAFYSQSRIRLTDIHDGTSNTLLLGEVTGHSQFRTPRTISSRHSFLCGPVSTDQIGWQSETVDVGAVSAFMFRSFHSNTAQVAFADGSVHRLDYGIDKSVLHALGSISGGEVIDTL